MSSLETNPNKLQEANLRTQMEFFLFEHRYESALRCLDSLIQLDEDNPSLHFEKATVLSKLERYEEALECCTIAGKVKEKCLEVNSLAMSCCLETDRLETAQKCFQLILQSRPDIESLFNLKDKMNRFELIKRLQIAEEEQTLSAMKKWLYMGGSRYDKLCVGNLGGDYRGVIATKSIKTKEKIVFVPRSHIITLEMAKKNRISAELIRKKVEMLSPKHTYISIFLLQETRKADSQWRLYLDILPKDHSSFPINYSAEELCGLVGSTFLQLIREKVEDLRTQYDHCVQFSAAMGQYSFKQFCWARIMVGSRIFGLKIDGVNTEILVPFADMLNHRLPKQTIWNFSGEENGFFIQSLCEIGAGEEVFDSYGRKCNSRFLLNYGFVLEDNADNEVCFRLKLQERDQNRMHKLQMLKEKDDYAKVFRSTVNFNSSNFYEFMGFLRFKEITDMQVLLTLERISKIRQTNLGYCPEKTPPFTLELEIKVWTELARLCVSTLSEYPTTLEEDQALLRSWKGSRNLRNILIIRSGEKKILKHFLQTSEEVVEVLSLGYKKAVQKIAANRQKSWAAYLAKILSLMPHQNKQEVDINMLNDVKEVQVEPQQDNQIDDEN